MTDSSSNGSLSGLLKYRFTKKPVPKLGAGVDNKSGGSGDASQSSQDSQKTVPYSLSPRESLSPQVMTKSPSFSQKSTQSPGFGTQGSTKTNPPSPVLGSRLGQQADTNGTATGKTSTHVDNPTIARLREMFPNGSENRMRAALIVYPNDFEKAVKFMKSEPSVQKAEKRPLSIVIKDDDEDDELPEITTKRKRIKMMPESPPAPIVMSVDSLKSDGPKADSVQFLRGCFPSKSVEHIESVLASNNGDVDLASRTLESEDSKDAKIASRLAGPSNGASSGFISKENPPKSLTANVSTLKPTSALKKASKGKRRELDLSDEDDLEEDEDEYETDADSDDSEDLDNRSKSETDNFLQFFEEATLEELLAMRGCSKKKAEAIISYRPYKTWENLYETFNTEKQLSTALISGCKEVMQVRNTIRRLMLKCESIAQQMGMVVSRLTGKEGKGGDDRYRITQQPELLTKEFSLQPYQLIGLSWLRVMHEQQVNGILADEMGLGKTIQAISFLAHLMENGEEGPHVIIVPSSTIENWLRELQQWCPTLKVIVYYGSQEERRAVRHSIFYQGEDFNVLLTTYNMATGATEDRALFKMFNFHYAVFDEGHMLKNMSSLRFQNLMKIAADRRLLLTGTPLQNNLLELMSLLCFVMPEIFQGKTEHLKKVFAMISRSEDSKKSRFERNRIAQAKRIMKPFVLRRLKRDVLNQLPQKTEHIERCAMIPRQQELYDSLVTKYSQEMSENEDGPAVSGGVGIFMQLRKAANHPLLLRSIYDDKKLAKMAKKIAQEPSHRERGALPNLIQEDMAVLNDFDINGLCKQYKKYLGKFELDIATITDSGKFRMLDKMLPGMKEKGDRVLLFSQFTMMLDILEVYLGERGHKYLRLDGQTPVTDRLQLIDRFNGEPEIFIFLLSTRAGGLGINLTAANTIILHDIDFNPYNDKQAEDRCHRLGQKREVTIYKLISEATVDEAMLSCANKKLDLEKDVTENEESEENSKDVVNLLREALKIPQKKKEGTDSEIMRNGSSSSNNSLGSSSKNVSKHDDEWGL